jgi:hypothetical protein
MPSNRLATIDQTDNSTGDGDRGSTPHGPERAAAQYEHRHWASNVPDHTIPHKSFRHCASATRNSNILQISSTKHRPNGGQFSDSLIILSTPFITRKYCDPVRASTDSMDCRTDGKVQPYSPTRPGYPLALLGSDSICEEFEGSCY